jgi:hypothetical protein
MLVTVAKAQEDKWLFTGKNVPLRHEILLVLPATVLFFCLFFAT